MGKRVFAIALLIALAVFLVGCGQTFKRKVKSFESEYSGGLDRTVTVYDMQGEPIKEYTWKIDVETNEGGGKVLFDLDGKRTIIYNATVIVQEN